jgi:hypothetical protein
MAMLTLAHLLAASPTTVPVPHRARQLPFEDRP